MRDLQDTMTPELEGVPPLPATPEKKTIAERRVECGYTGPRAVKACRNCVHASGYVVSAQWIGKQRSLLRCGKHDFPVELGAICADHAPMKKGRAQ